MWGQVHWKRSIHNSKRPNVFSQKTRFHSSWNTVHFEKDRQTSWYKSMERIDGLLFREENMETCQWGELSMSSLWRGEETPRQCNPFFESIFTNILKYVEACHYNWNDNFAKRNDGASEKDGRRRMGGAIIEKEVEKRKEGFTWLCKVRTLTVPSINIMVFPILATTTSRSIRRRRPREEEGGEEKEVLGDGGETLFWQQSTHESGEKRGEKRGESACKVISE